MAVLSPPPHSGSTLPRGRSYATLPRYTRPGRPLVLALEGRDTDRSVVLAGDLLRRRTGGRLVAVSVNGDRRAAVAVVVDQFPELPVWHTSITGDGSAIALVAEAMSVDARLLIVGRGQNDIWEQLVQAETSVEVVRRADRPVLIVDRGFTSLPRRAVVAVAFDDTSRRAAAEAVQLMEGDGTLVLAHVVEPRSANGLGDRLLAERASELGLRDRVNVQTVQLEGPPATALLAYARRTRADLIAAGISGARGRKRMFTGGVATTLLRQSPCSTLLTPA